MKRGRESLRLNNAAGWTDEVTDPRGIQTKTFYDNLGRTTKSVQAYDGGAITNTANPKGSGVF